MLYQKLLESCKKQFIQFFKNTNIFENQFNWSDINTQCYEEMYKNNSYDNIARVNDLKQFIPELSILCKKCAQFYIPKRNESIPKYDVLLGKQLEDALMHFLSDELGVDVNRADLNNRSLPDCKILKKDGSVAAYLEIKYHGAPFVMAFKITGRYCYEGSATLDYDKILKQFQFIEDNQLDAPIFYVHWIDYPCLKGIFYETIEQVKNYLSSSQNEFSRRMRDGDKEKSKTAIYLKKKYSPLLYMGDFDSFLKQLKTLI